MAAAPGGAPDSNRRGTMVPYLSSHGGPLAGVAEVPGDKSISHRALILGALAVGETVVTGLLEAEDVMATAAAMRALGAQVERRSDGAWSVRGVGVGGLNEPADVLDLGNSGTAARLIIGMLASHPVTAILTGDASLRSRPMRRVTDPLGLIGARFSGRSGGRLPLAVTGTDDALPIEYEVPVPSAQVKSAVLLAGLNTRGQTRVIERTATRDHTERMLRHFGATVDVTRREDGSHLVTLDGYPELRAADLAVPADPSSAAFPLVAATMVPGSTVTVPGICMNETRTGLLTTLGEMGAALSIENRRDEGGEPVADVTASTAPLRGVEVPPERAASMIDEYPILASAAACAEGKTVMRGIGELRVKESDRLAAVAAGLQANGVSVETGDDWMVVHGTGGDVPGGGTATTHFDHRIAMSFLMLGLAARAPVRIDDARGIETSFPGFADLINGLGGRLAPLNAPAA